MSRLTSHTSNCSLTRHYCATTHSERLCHSFARATIVAVIINFVNEFIQGINELFPGRKSSWIAMDMPDQTGRVAIVTGGNAGVKVPIALEERNALHGVAQPTARREGIVLLEKESWPRPINQLLADEFDLQLCNELGHFYLTQLLMPVLLKTSVIKPNDKHRVITTSAGMFRMYPQINYSTLRDGPARRKLSPLQLYAQSKTANIILSRELAPRGTKSRGRGKFRA
ncbi:hypothetical protein BKA62DRAFT_777999 [Auriculariales sp. MPI-PUGE-AT-0066]|nr:hypothetical protein BKA62DRAFT_777999 [Auriculariales sp. MPI-PUGE-AT-0066]